MLTTQQAVLITPVTSGSTDAVAVSIPSFDASNSSTNTAIYASLFAPNADIQVLELPLNKHLPFRSSQILLLHASDSQEAENRVAGEVLWNPSDSEQNNQAIVIRGKAYIFYAEAKKDFDAIHDFQALHEVCYDAKLSKMGRSAGGQGDDAGAEMARLFQEKLQIAQEQRMQDGEEDEDAWTDEDVEKPREKKEEVDSDEGEDGQEDDEESDGSYEDESELDSEDDDDENDPRKKALLDAIKNMISKDGKLDLERLGLVEKNGKLVPKDS